MINMDKKTKRFYESAEQNDWAVEREDFDRGGVQVTSLTITKDSEEIYIEWENGRLITAPRYNYMGATKSLHNAADTIKKMSAPPSAVRRTRRATPARVDAPGETVEESPEPRRTESEVKAANAALGIPELDSKGVLSLLVGRTVVVQGKISPETFAVHIPRKKSKHNPCVRANPDGTRSLLFIAQEGFRAINVDRVIAIG